MHVVSLTWVLPGTGLGPCSRHILIRSGDLMCALSSKEPLTRLLDDQPKKGGPRSTRDQLSVSPHSLPGGPPVAPAPEAALGPRTIKIPHGGSDGSGSRARVPSAAAGGAGSGLRSQQQGRELAPETALPSSSAALRSPGLTQSPVPRKCPTAWRPGGGPP